MTSPRDESPTVISNPSAYPFRRKHVLFVFGTRPEAIKLCPLIDAFRAAPIAESLQPVVCVTAQHRGMLDQVLGAFNIQPDYDLNLMQPGQTLAGLSARLLEQLTPIFAAVQPAITVVQGDTTSTLCGALSAFYHRVPVAHVEAGLRTFDLNAPFPEEMNRVVTGRLAALHFAATQWAADNLLREGVAADRIEVTGNTGIDAVLSISRALSDGRLSLPPLPLATDKKIIVVTAHRRESFGEPLLAVCAAIADLAQRDDVQVVWPVHPNPNVNGVVHATFRAHPNVVLLEPLDYLAFVGLMQRAYLLITDSGGVQEEGPSLGKPILVLREQTERPEAVAAGTVKLVGTDRNKIVAEATRLLDHPQHYDAMSRLHNPYGDGKASERIARRIASFLAA